MLFANILVMLALASTVLALSYLTKYLFPIEGEEILNVSELFAKAKSLLRK